MSTSDPNPSASPATNPSTASPKYIPRYADIAINLTDATYRGKYHGKQHHEDDLADVVQRALDAGCTKMMVTGSNLKESKDAIRLAEEYPGICYATVGVHPCCAKLFDQHGPQKYLRDLETVARSGISRHLVTAFGEIGLDYDRLFLTDKPTQLKYFRLQLDLASRLNLPLFLHSRACHRDFIDILKPHLPSLPGGLVHSFTGTVQEMQELVELGLYIGVNGCSMKTEENLEVVRQVPLDKLMLETDGPWCEIRKSHASSKYLVGAPELPKNRRKEKWERGLLVNGRNEPVAISNVAWVVAQVKGVSVEEVCERAWENSIRLFGLGEKTV